MSVVSKKWKGGIKATPLLVVLLTLLFSAEWSFGKSAPLTREDEPLRVFNDPEIPSEVQAQYSLSSSNSDLYFEVYFVNSHEEPYSEPIHLFIGYRKGEEPFKRLFRSFAESNPQTYCQFGEPQILDRSDFADELSIDLGELPTGHPLGVEGEYLVVPVFRFDDIRGECDVHRVQFEVFSLKSLTMD